LPSGESMPIPVTTTRLRDTGLSFSLVYGTITAFFKEKTARRLKQCGFPVTAVSDYKS